MTSAEISRIPTGASGTTILDEPSAKHLLAAAGVAIPLGRVIGSADELPSALAGMAFPLVAKLVSPGATHKSDVGGVKLHLQSPDEVRAAVQDLEASARNRGLRIDGFLVEEMIAGQELVIGGVMDPRFGPILMLGLGGVFVEVLRDVVFRICPLDRVDAIQMIDDLQGAPLLRGARGRAPISEAALVQMILAVGGEDGVLMAGRQRIAELDINPVIVDGVRAVACDARIVLQHG